jgi:hypothetical protein
MAWMALYKTKAEIEGIRAALSHDHFEEMVKGISHARDYFKNFVTVLNAAEIRIMCAMASALAKEGRLADA